MAQRVFFFTLMSVPWIVSIVGCVWLVPGEDPPWSAAIGCWTAQVRPYFPELVPGRSARSVSPSAAAALLVCTPEQTVPAEQTLPAPAPSAQKRFFSESRVKQSSDGVAPLLLQVFNELDQAGSLLAKEIMEDGLPVHNGKGDVRKCPYYTANQDKGRSCIFRALLLGQVCQHSH